MITTKVKVEDKTKDLEKAAEKAAFNNFRHAAASISKDSKQSLERKEGPSEEGEPPHTHKGVFLRRAIRYAADKEGAVIGPMASIVGLAGRAHELGEVFHGTDYPERPFMQPALDRAVPRMAKDWQGSIGN